MTDSLTTFSATNERKHQSARRATPRRLASGNEPVDHHREANAGLVFTAAFWIGLVIATGTALYLLQGLTVRPAGFLACAVLPALLTLTGPLLQTGKSSAVFEVFAWLSLAVGAVLISGGAASPLTVLFAIPPLHALVVGERRLAVEAAIFAALGFVGSVAMGALSPLPVLLPGETVLAGLLALCGVLQIGLMIAVAVARMISVERRAEQRWAALPVVGIQAGPDGRIRSITGDVRRVLGCGPEHFAGVPLSTLVPGGMAALDDLDRPLTFPAPWDVTRSFEARHSRNAEGYTLVLLEIPAARARLKTAVPEANTATVHANDDADTLRSDLAAKTEALTGQSNMVAALGHEMKNMVNPVSGYAELIASGTSGEIAPAYQGFARSIKQSAEHLALLIDDLMTAARGRSGNMLLESEPLDLGDEAEDAVSLMKAQAREANVRLELDLGDAAITVRGDRKALRQVLVNLISNALKYSAEEGVVTVQVRSGGQHATLSVIDTGEGPVG